MSRWHRPTVKFMGGITCKIPAINHLGCITSSCLFAFRVSRIDDAKCIVVTRVCLCVCAFVCLSLRGRMPTLLHGSGCNLGSGRGCPLVVHYWADLQSVHGLRCYGNIMRTRNVRRVLVLALCLVCIYWTTCSSP